MKKESSNPFVAMFEDPERASVYADGPAKFTPGFSDVHRMVNVLIREGVKSDAHLLIHGCGGGLELEALAVTNPHWRFVGVDPARPMLDEAEKRMNSLMDRVSLHHGYIDTAPTGPFDAATSLLTLHFLDEDERTETLSKIVARLKTGAPFIAVHSSFPQQEPDRTSWLQRYAAFAVSSGADLEMAEAARQAVGKMTTAFDPARDMQIFKNAGLTRVTEFYSAFTWRGWVGYAP